MTTSNNFMGGVEKWARTQEEKDISFLKKLGNHLKKDEAVEVKSKEGDARIVTVKSV